MLGGFELARRDVGEVTIRYSIGGNGPPVLLLHGNPQTHLMWHKVAPRLAECFTVVAADLRGYGGSGKPKTTSDHAPYAKRAMAADQLALMKALGFDRFAAVGHDRGARVAHRLALDHPQAVERLAVLDIVPTLAAFEGADMAFGLGYYHWFFLAQPYDLPERLIGADPEWFWRRHTTRQPTPPGFFSPEALADYLRWFAEPATIHAICEDYRAAASIDLEHDRADREAGRRVACPVLALWGRRGRLEEWYDPLAVWRAYAAEVRGHGLDCGHYLPEERPEETAAALLDFLGAAG